MGGTRNIHGLVLFLVLFAAGSSGLASAPAQAPGLGTKAVSAERPAGTRWAFNLGAGPLLGLDRALRGAEVGAGFTLSRGGLGLVLAGGASWDGGLGAGLASASLGIAFGEGLILSLGSELPLAGLVAQGGSGLRIGLEPAAWPCRFSLATVLAEWPGRGSRTPSLGLVAELSYTAYRVTAVQPGGGGPTAPLAEALAGLSGFSLGFRARLGLRLSWEGPIRTERGGNGRRVSGAGPLPQP